MVTRPYSTLCQFNRGGPPQTIRWVVLPDHSEAFPGTSAIGCLDWANDREIYQDPIGEIWGAPRPYSGRFYPPGILDAMAGHYCGTLDDFEFGGVYEPDHEPQRYGGWGFPLCCDPPALLAGGAGAGGRAQVSFPNASPVYGGLALGGTVPSSIVNTEVIRGGLALGGRVPSSVRYPTAPRGGLALGGNVPNRLVTPMAPRGGVALGGRVPGRLVGPQTPYIWGISQQTVTTGIQLPPGIQTTWGIFIFLLYPSGFSIFLPPRFRQFIFGIQDPGRQWRQGGWFGIYDPGQGTTVPVVPPINGGLGWAIAMPGVNQPTAFECTTGLTTPSLEIVDDGSIGTVIFGAGLSGDPSQTDIQVPFPYQQGGTIWDDLAGAVAGNVGTVQGLRRGRTRTAQAVVTGPAAITEAFNLIAIFR